MSHPRTVDLTLRPPLAAGAILLLLSLMLLRPLGADSAHGAAAGATITLDHATSITIKEVGPFGTATGKLTDVLERNLNLALQRDRLTGDGPAVTITIEARAVRWSDLPRESIADIGDVDAFEITVADSPPRVHIAGATPMAAGYGVMAFIEDYLGVLYAMPGELGLCVPDVGDDGIALPVGHVRRAPWVITRAMSGMRVSVDGVSTEDRQAGGVLRDYRSFFLADDYFKSLAMHNGIVSHNMINVFPIAECEREPELFPMLPDGTRYTPPAEGRGGSKNAHASWHPCYTHPRAVEIAIDRARAAFDAGQLFFSLGINDGKRVQCQCERCVEVGWPHAYYDFVKAVANAVKDRYPPQMVGVLAYGDVGLPPRDLELPDNVLVNIAGFRKDVWEGIAPTMGTYEYLYGAGYVVPNLPLDAFDSNMRYYRDWGMRLYYAEFYPVWAFDMPKAYIVSRMLWDREGKVSAREHLARFCARAFGPAGEAMTRYYETAAEWRAGDVRAGEFTPIWNRTWPFSDSMQFHRCGPDLHARLTACLDEAGKAKGLTDRQARRLELVSAFTEFSRVYTAMDQLAQAVMNGAINDADSLNAVADHIAELRADADAIMATLEAHPEWFAGSSITFESFTERTWPLTELLAQLDVALVSAASRMTEPPVDLEGYAVRTAGTDLPLAPLRREEHAWYKPTQTTRMAIGRARDGCAFNNAPNVIIEEADDPRHDGKTKAQWLHIDTRDLALTDVIELTLEVEGGRGVLEVIVALAPRFERSRERERDRNAPDPHANGDDPRAAAGKQTIAHSFHALGADGEPTSMTRRLVIAPQRYLNADLLDACRVQVRLLWAPDDSSARLQGVLRARPLNAR